MRLTPSGREANPAEARQSSRCSRYEWHPAILLIDRKFVTEVKDLSGASVTIPVTNPKETTMRIDADSGVVDMDTVGQLYPRMPEAIWLDTPLARECTSTGKRNDLSLYAGRAEIDGTRFVIGLGFRGAALRDVSWTFDEPRREVVTRADKQRVVQQWRMLDQRLREWLGISPQGQEPYGDARKGMSRMWRLVDDLLTPELSLSKSYYVKGGGASVAVDRETLEPEISIKYG